MSNEQRAAAEEKVHYVEALASAEEYPAGDYWLTLTDAARVTKRQDKSIRDWVQQGKLPVRPLQLGINKRTRQVRASDLAKLTPIVDQTAAITSETGQIYLASIPGELQQMRTDHQQLLAEAAHLQQEVEAQGKTLQEQLENLGRRQHQDLRDLDQSWHHEQEQARTEIRETFTAIEAQLVEQEQAHVEVREAVTALEEKMDGQQEQQQQAMDALNTTWRQRLDHADERRQMEVQRLDQRVDVQQHEIHQLSDGTIRLETTLHALEQKREEDWTALRQELAMAVSQEGRARQQSHHELQQAIQAAEQRSLRALEVRQEQMRTAVDQQEQAMSHRLTHLEQGAAQRQREQEQQLQHLGSELAGQRQGLERFADRLSELEQGQQRMLEHLQQQIEQLARRQPKTKRSDT